MYSKALNIVNHAILAQTDLKAGLGKILGVILMLSFISAVVMVIAGALKWNKDPESAKQSMIGGAVVAAAATIVTILFKAFGLSFDITPSFDF